MSPAAPKQQTKSAGKQLSIIQQPAPCEREWQGMPEFVQEDLAPKKSLLVHFANFEDMQAFAKLVGQTVTERTKSIWYPKAEIGHMVTKRYADGSAGR